MHSVKERVEPSLGIGRLAKLVPRSKSGSLFGGCMHSVKVSEWNHHWAAEQLDSATGVWVGSTETSICCGTRRPPIGPSTGPWSSDRLSRRAVDRAPGSP